MNTLLIFLIILIVLIVIVILIDKSNILKKPESLTKKDLSVEKQQASLPSNINLPYPTWSQPQPFPGSTGTGLCNIYTFLAGDSTPGIPSYTKLNNNERGWIIQPTDPNFVCLDGDQIFANTISHKCINSQGTSAGAGCYATVNTGIYGPGDPVPLGTVEGDTTVSGSSLLYTSCVPSGLNSNKKNSSYCIGDIGLIIPQFTPQQNYNSDTNQCLAGLYFQGSTGSSLEYNMYNTAMEQCNLSEPTQIFRFIRYTYTSSNGLIQSESGNLVAIIHRYTGYYLAPKFNTLNYFDSNNAVQYSYQYDNPVINYSFITDNYGNNFNTSIDLILINPNVDTRNGVYWLLQDQVINPEIQPQTFNFDSYNGIGVYTNQENYATQFKPKIETNNNTTPTVESYFFTQTAKYCNATNGGATGCTVPGYPYTPVALTIPNNTNVGCLFGTNLISPATVIGVPLGIAPQQIVYVPDLNLLPNPDPSTTWTYLLNSFSINIDSSNNPILTPFRTSMTADLQYNCLDDPNDMGNNYFTYLESINPSAGTQYVYTKPYRDSQFINYSQFAQQIQTGVSQNNPSDNVNYNQYSNPFN